MPTVEGRGTVSHHHRRRRDERPGRQLQRRQRRRPADRGRRLALLGRATSCSTRAPAPNAARQEGPHAHSINLDPSGRFAVAADLGLDRLLVYRYDPSAGTLTPNDPPSTAIAPGVRPPSLRLPSRRPPRLFNQRTGVHRHRIRLRRRGRHAHRDPDRLDAPEGFDGKSFTADVHVHPSGRFLYGSNRGHDSIAIFRIDEQTGKPDADRPSSTGGRTPRNFAIDPSGRFLLAANQGSGSIVVFRIDAETGTLEPTGHSAAVSMPVCVKFVTTDE